jgi:polyisoprenoid-binding protein YceI
MKSRLPAGSESGSTSSPGVSEVVIDARKVWTREQARDARLCSADFLDVENLPKITSRGN